MNVHDVVERMNGISPWFHQIDLGSGIITPDDSDINAQRKNADIYFGCGVQGCSVLDIGAWDGFYSFEAERRGASDVLAVDKFCWGGGGVGNRKAFELAREVLNSRVPRYDS